MRYAYSCSSARRLISLVVLLASLPFLACTPDSPSDAMDASTGTRDHGLRSSTYISGQVVDTSGNPITEFECMVRGGVVSANERAPNGFLLSPKLVSHPRGDFRVDYREVHGAKQTLIVGATGYVTRFYVFEPDVLDSRSDIRIVLDEGVVVAGEVVNAKGKGVPGASIWIGPVPVPGHHGRPGAIAETDGRGRFTSDRIPAGTTTLGVLHPDYPATSFDVTLSPTATNDPVLVLPSGVTLSGTISFGEVPAQDGLILAETKTGDKSAKPTDGVFEIKGVPPDVTQVSFKAFRRERTNHESSWYLRRRVDLANREELQIDATFPAGNATLLGGIFLNGKAIGSKYGGALYVTPTGDSQDFQITAHANERGEYTISNMPAGEWDVKVHVFDEKLGGFDSEQVVTTSTGEVTEFNVNFPLDDK